MMSTIAVQALTKRYGAVTAINDLSFRISAGRITGFLGPNGAGKSTTMRILLGLARPTSGHATIDGQPYARLRDPLRHVGAVLDANVFHPGRSGRTALRIAARPAGIAHARVDELLDLVGLGNAARRRVGGYSLLHNASSSPTTLAAGAAAALLAGYAIALAAAAAAATTKREIGTATG
jgi:ABC-2 type transport system ATP-binding protein